MPLVDPRVFGQEPGLFGIPTPPGMGGQQSTGLFGGLINRLSGAPNSPLFQLGVGLLSGNNFGEGLQLGMKGIQGVQDRRSAQQDAELRRQMVALQQEALKQRMQAAQAEAEEKRARQEALGNAIPGLFSQTISEPGSGQSMQTGGLLSPELRPLIESLPADQQAGLLGAIAQRHAIPPSASPDAMLRADVARQDRESRERVAAENRASAERAKGLASKGDVAGLRKEFTSASKPFVEVSSAFDRVLAASNVPSAAGDIALVTNFAKMLDPGSVVRPGEFETAAAAAGLSDRIIAAAAKVDSGQILSPAQRQDFVDTARRQFGVAKTAHDRRVGEFSRLAETSGIPVDQVISDLSTRDPDGSSEPPKVVNATIDELRDLARDPQRLQMLTDEQLELMERRLAAGR